MFTNSTTIAINGGSKAGVISGGGSAPLEFLHWLNFSGFIDFASKVL